VKMPNPWAAGTVALSGLLTAGLLALPVTAVASSSGDAKVAKRDDDGTELVLVTDDDVDDDDTGMQKAQTRTRTQAQTRTRTRTRTQGQTRTRTRTRTGANSGRDHSRGGPRVDWTNDGPGAKKRDWSRNHTNDRSRHNTRGRR
jgi:hypothetical protein